MEGGEFSPKDGKHRRMGQVTRIRSKSVNRSRSQSIPAPASPGREPSGSPKSPLSPVSPQSSLALFFSSESPTRGAQSPRGRPRAQSASRSTCNHGTDETRYSCPYSHLPHPLTLTLTLPTARSDGKDLRSAVRDWFDDVVLRTPRSARGERPGTP